MCLRFHLFFENLIIDKLHWCSLWMITQANQTDRYYKLRVFSVVWGKIYRISYLQLLVKFVRIRAIKQLLFDSPNTLRSIEPRLVLSIFISAVVKTPTLVRFLLEKIREQLLTIQTRKVSLKIWLDLELLYMLIFYYNTNTIQKNLVWILILSKNYRFYNLEISKEFKCFRLLKF